MKSTPITKESLVAYGFVDNTIGKEKDSSWFPFFMIKDLRSEEAKLENPDETFALVVTGERNVQEFALALPHGSGTLFLGFKDIEHIEAFETAIGSYSPEW